MSFNWNLALLTSLLTLSMNSQAGPREQAKRLFISLTGTSPDSSQLSNVESKIRSGNIRSAARDIIDSRNGITTNGAFYNVTLKDFATPWTNEEGTNLADLNDVSATVIGVVRDEAFPFNEILWRNVVYQGDGLVMDSNFSYQSGGNIRFRDNNDQWVTQSTRYSNSEINFYKGKAALYIPHKDLIIETQEVKSSNNHYKSLQDLGVDLSDPLILVRKMQNPSIHRDTTAVSGIMSLRAWGEAYYSAGTNRAPVAFSMKNFMCKSMEQLNDTSVPDFRNRRDVDRAPGGNSATYKSLCVGCHAGMDAMAGAFAYYDFKDGAISYEHGQVVTKMNHNAIFPDGFITQSDSWMNLWNQGQNASLGWGSASSGNGVRSLAQMYSQTNAFKSCMAEQVFEKICLRKPASTIEKSIVDTLGENFGNDNYNLKNLFIETAIVCVGE